MKIKICGMKFPDNLEAIAALNPDYLGFIFYPKSKRFVGNNVTSDALASVPKSIKKVGVFVDADYDEILETVQHFSLDMVQLHGNESVALCRTLREKSIPVIKAFAIETAEDLALTTPYDNQVDFFLFDTKGALPGGNGIAFDWNTLNHYSLQTPFFLSGGIGLENAGPLAALEHDKMMGVDANSRLEDEPGLKNIEKTRLFINTIRIHGKQ